MIIELGRAGGCGPDFPNWLLIQGDQALLVAPDGNFATELARMNLGPARVQAVLPEDGDGYDVQSMEAELGDLRRALKQAKTPAAEASRICREHQEQRRRLAEFTDGRQHWKESHSGNLEEPAAADEPAGGGKSKLFSVQVVAGLPDEFADYFEGFIAWHNPALADKEIVRTAWERLLARPEAERRYKSTWAAFMLGKSWEEADPEKAAGYFKQVRDLARQGYRDTLGLAAASLGLEARVCLKQSNFEAAIENYLDQMASGDPSATNSLATAAFKALGAGPEALLALARNPRTQKVITAYLISHRRDNSAYNSKPEDPETERAGAGSAAANWLKAVEQAGAKDVDSAEALALAAYRENDMAGAGRWIKRAPNSPLAQWLCAKLFLRAGKLQSAAALLARISPQFPIIHEGTNAPALVDRKDSLTAAGVSVERQVQGELGVLRLARGEYVQALDSLLNAGFWMDAAYVAERVLTLEELRSYVDRFWPAATAAQVADENERSAGSDVSPAKLREQIRYLLGRRLTREFRGDQAREYYPAAWLVSFDQLVAGLHQGWDETAPPRERADALFQAAMIARTNGMELMGTEVTPDWHYHSGQFEEGVTGEHRDSNGLAVVVRPSNDELRRHAEHLPEPNERFHYRYQAAQLAWEAAKLLPDNDNFTAQILWQGGSFLKHRDPESADIFYKALVRRNRKTVLGAEADRQRWFPILDDHGNIVPQDRGTAAPEAQTEAQSMPQPNANETPDPEASNVPAFPRDQPAARPANEYIVRPGDSLATVARALSKAGVSVTVRDIFDSNPGLDPAKLLVGQVIFVPAGTR